MTRWHARATTACGCWSFWRGNPIVDIAFVADRLDVARNTARNLVNDFLRLGILSALDEGKQRYRTYMYTDYVRLLSQGAEPL